jgi:hypothetical protein
MAQCFFLLKQFEDVLIYLKSIKTYFYNDDDFNWNYGIAKVGTPLPSQLQTHQTTIGFAPETPWGFLFAKPIDVYNVAHTMRTGGGGRLRRGGGGAAFDPERQVLRRPHLSELAGAVLHRQGQGAHGVGAVPSHGDVGG